MISMHGRAAPLSRAMMIDPAPGGAGGVLGASLGLGTGPAYAPALGSDSELQRADRANKTAQALRALRGTAETGVLNNVFALFFAWGERRYAANCCRQLLELYWTVAALHPGLTGVPLYRKIVAARVGAAGLDADAILDCAEESFAAWPVSRELNYRDVVHCLVVLEFAASHKNSRWIHANMKWVVSASIPHDL